MKYTFLIVLSLSLVSFNTSFSQKIKPSGKITFENRPVQEFEDIDLDGMFNVFLSQSDTASVRVETDENLQQLIVVESKDAKLKVYDKDESKKYKHIVMNVYIKAPDIQKLKVDLFESKLTCTGVLKVTDFELNNVSSGLVYLNINATEFKANFNAFGDMILEGNAETAKFVCSGSGNVNGKKFTAGLFDIDYSGSGNVEVAEIKEISLKSTGNGDIFYKGQPEIRKMEVTGLGRVKKRVH
ncbi:MAG: head GIN domain-containing protein [Bacteroidota bacterium]|nr:head GIN domain-containing protein [Bacteroidota bacterium]